MTIASICDVCHGTGWIETATDDPYGPDIPDVERCPRCRGKKPPREGGRRKEEKSSERPREGFNRGEDS